jgi:hypothetical protein
MGRNMTGKPPEKGFLEGRPKQHKSGEGKMTKVAYTEILPGAATVRRIRYLYKNSPNCYVSISVSIVSIMGLGTE